MCMVLWFRFHFFAAGQSIFKKQKSPKFRSNCGEVHLLSQIYEIWTLIIINGFLWESWQFLWSNASKYSEIGYWLTSSYRILTVAHIWKELLGFSCLIQPRFSRTVLQLLQWYNHPCKSWSRHRNWYIKLRAASSDVLIEFARLCFLSVLKIR